MEPNQSGKCSADVKDNATGRGLARKRASFRSSDAIQIMTAKNDSMSYPNVLRGIFLFLKRTGAMKAGVPLLKLLLDDCPLLLKHKFQSIIVPRRSLYVSPPVSILPAIGTKMLSIEMSV